MPFKSKSRMLAYARKWRREHPTYMRDYGRRYYVPKTGRRVGARVAK